MILNKHEFVIFILNITILLFLNPIIINCLPSGYRGSDICSHWNGRRHFLELGERGELHAYNVSASGIRTSLYNPPPLNLFNKTTKLDLWYQCNLELVTCAECVIRITFTYTNFSKQCDKPISPNPIINANNDGSTAAINCPCEQIHFSEPPYDQSISGQYFCGDGKVFRSKTRTLLLKFFYRATKSHIFSLQYFSERNVRIISGSPKQSIVRNYSQVVPQIISTPYFPVPYPRDYSIEHILTCETDNCRVRLDFTDFQLGLTSKMEIFDSNGQMVDSYTGEHFRPPILVSTGKSLLIQFRGNGVTGYGFRVEVTFISEKQLDEKETIPYTDCGGMVTGMGGAITMMNMIENTTEVRYYDCIWLIKPSSNYMVMKTHIMLRVETFHGMASKSQLIVRQGITSDSQDLEEVIWPNKGMSKTNHIVPVLTGYYIRLRGVFGISSRLAIVYSIFNYMNCYIGSEFLCQNNHCISIRLHCDGFDHCGDGSDEPDTCNDEWSQRTANRGWYSHKPNYYFPKNEEYNDLKTATGIFILSSLGVLIVISMWMIVLYRIGIRARNQRQRELQNHLQTISELLDRQDETITIDEPPVYEAPPDYEEVIKIGMDDEILVSSGQHGRRHHRRHRQHSPASSSISASLCSPINTALIHGCNNNLLQVPSTSSRERNIPEIRTNELQEIADRVLQATAICDVTETSSRAIRQSMCKDQSCQTGSVPSNKTIPVWSQLPSTSGQQNNSNNSLGTPTQFEESSAEFRDQSLNYSLSLAISPTCLSESTKHRPQSSIYPDSNFLDKKSMIICNKDETYLVKTKRLRHTFSTPETWLFSSVCAQDVNYGSNLNIDHNSILSKTSTFCSDLPKDDNDINHLLPSTSRPISQDIEHNVILSQTVENDNNCRNSTNIQNIIENQNDFSQYYDDLESPSSPERKVLIAEQDKQHEHEYNHEQQKMHFIHHLLNKDTSEVLRNNRESIDDSNTSSCFGNVNFFNGRKIMNSSNNNNNNNSNCKILNELCINQNENSIKIRSKSFTQQHDRRNQIKMQRLQRSSSADFLLNINNYMGSLSGPN